MQRISERISPADNIIMSLFAKVYKSGFAFARDIKIAHSIFALPFAASALWLCKLPMPAYMQSFLLLIAMISARSFAMGINRLLDWQIDSKNPRTRMRAIPSQQLSIAAAKWWLFIAATVFIVVSFALNPVAGWCSPIVLAIFAIYPLWKRWSWGAHWYLGLCLGMAPMGVEVALASHLSPSTLLLGLAICLWTGGFDVLYAMQDLSFDKELGLHSVPVRFGVRFGLWISRISFVFMVGLLLVVGSILALGFFYYFGVFLIALVLICEHILLKKMDQRGHSPWLDVAFFNLNASVSLLFLTAVLVDAWWRNI